MTLSQSIGPFQWETSTPFAYVAADAAVAPPAAYVATETKTSAASNLPAGDPTRPSLDEAVFGKGKAHPPSRLAP